MKYDIVDVMDTFSVGQILIANDGVEYVFEDVGKKGALVRNRETGQKSILQGSVEISLDKDEEWTIKMEEEYINEMIRVAALRRMKPGQHFISSDGKEYIFLNRKIKNFSCIDADKQTKKITRPPDFFKKELQKRSPMTYKCKYCNSYSFVEDPDVLCLNCQRKFNRKLFSELLDKKRKSKN